MGGAGLGQLALHAVVEGGPLLVVHDGRIVPEALGSGTLTERELLALLRVEGIRDTGEVECAFFEMNGRLSVFRRPEGKRTAGRTTMPEKAHGAGQLGGMSRVMNTSKVGKG